LGDLRFFTSEFAQQVVKDNVRLTASVEEGGGPIYDMGIYCINALATYSAAEPTQVVATSASKNETRFRVAEEMTAAVLKFPGDRLRLSRQASAPPTLAGTRWSARRAL